MPFKKRTMPGANRDDESGRYTETYPPEAFVEAIEAEGGMAGTQAVARRVGCSYETAYKKLRSLEDAGKVDHRQAPAGNAVLWEVVGDE